MEWYHFQDEAALSTPSLVLYRERIAHNFAQMLAVAGGPERLRPHVKTHKLGPLVEAQIALGITKFKCATIAEAEMCARAGARDVLLAYPPTQPAADRLASLAETFPDTKFAALADSSEGIAALALAAARLPQPLDVYLDLDCGMQRTGAPIDAAFALYGEIARAKPLRAAGLHAYDGHIHDAGLAVREAMCAEAFAPVLALRRELEGRGHAVPALVAGGSPTFAIHARHADRELSPGTTVLWDFGYADKFPDLPFLPAALVATRVVSKPGHGKLCLDLGHKAVAAENPPPRVRFMEAPDAAAVMHSEEHLVIETPDAARFSIGQLLHGVPRHICPTVALYAEAAVVESGSIVAVWPIEARARRLTI